MALSKSIPNEEKHLLVSGLWGESDTGISSFVLQNSSIGDQYDSSSFPNNYYVTREFVERSIFKF